MFTGHIHNQRSNPLAADPTHTTTIRRRFERDIQRRMNKLKSHLREFLIGLDALGMKRRRSFVMMAQPREFEFHTDPAKLLEFNAWFTRQVQADVYSVPAGTPAGVPWTAQYVESAYKRGQINAYLSSHQSRFAESVGVGDVSLEQFLRDSFAAPEAMGKIQLLATRSFEQLKGISSQMGSDMNRILAQGMIDGTGPAAIAKEMAERIDGLTRSRAMLIARTEVIHAHAEGQLDAFTELGVEELGVMAEWSTAGDDRVCPDCEGMEGEVFTVKEAHGLIPFHPNCRCAWLPYDSELISKEAVKRVADGDMLASAQPEIEGNSMVSIIRTAGSQGWDYKTTKQVLNKAGYFPNDGTIRIQLRAGKLGHGSTVSPEVLERLRRGEIVGPGPVVPPPGPTPPPPEPVPLPQPVVVEVDLPSTVTIIRQAGNQGMSFAETKAMLNAAGLAPADATIRTQLRLGKLGQGTMVEPTLFERLRRGEVRARGAAPLPGATTPTPDETAVGTRFTSAEDYRQAVLQAQRDFKPAIEDSRLLLALEEKRAQLIKERNQLVLHSSVAEQQKVEYLERYRELSQELKHVYKQQSVLSAHMEASPEMLRAPLMEPGGMQHLVPKIAHGDLPKHEESAMREVLSWVPASRVTEAERYDVRALRFIKDSPGDTNNGTYWHREKKMYVHQRLGIDQRKATAAHEYAHHLSYQIPDIYRKQNQFFQKRTVGESVEHLDGYSSAVNGKKDKWADGTTVYAGRVYSDGRSPEVIAVGVEYLYRDPAGFAKKDPEYFNEVVSWLKDLPVSR